MSNTATEPTAAPGNELEAFQHGDLDPATARHLAAQWRESQRLAMTAVVPKSITHKRQKVGANWQDVAQPPEVVKATVFAVVRYGDVFGFSPAVSLGKIDVIEGRLEPRYDALLGLMIDAGHQTRIDVNDERAILRVRRSEDRGDPDGWQEVSFTAAEAREAGYIKANPDDRDRKGAWYTRRADMLLSKAAKRAFRWITPDVLVQSGADDLVDGVEVEAMVAPARQVLADIPPAIDPDDEPVDAEIIDEDATKKGVDDDAADDEALPADQPGGPTDRDGGVPAAESTPTSRGGDSGPGDPDPAPPSLPLDDDEPVDAEVIDDEPPAPERGSRLPLAQQIAMRAQEAGVDRALVIRAVTQEAKSSGKDVTGDEGRQVLEAIAEIKAGRLAVAEVDGEAMFGTPEALAQMAAAAEDSPAAAEAESTTPRRIEPQHPASDEAAWDADAWREFLRSRGVKVTELIREATRVCGDRGVRPPATLDDLAADPQLAAELRGFVEDLALERSGS